MDCIDVDDNVDIELDDDNGNWPKCPDPFEYSEDKLSEQQGDHAPEFTILCRGHTFRVLRSILCPEWDQLLFEQSLGSASREIDLSAYPAHAIKELMSALYPGGFRCDYSAPLAKMTMGSSEDKDEAKGKGRGEGEKEMDKEETPSLNRLCWHIKMHVISDKCNVVELARLTLDKYKRAVRSLPVSVSSAPVDPFLKTLTIICKIDPRYSKELREFAFNHARTAVRPLAVGLAELRDLFEEILHLVPELAIEVVSAYLSRRGDTPITETYCSWMD